MATKTFFLKFGTQKPAIYSGLFPTMTVFSVQGLTAISAPGITESPTGTGIYQFKYGTTLPVVFVCDGGASIPIISDRFISAVLDPIQSIDQQFGYSTDSFGATNSDPATLWGYVKRIQELFEGDGTLTKGTGIWNIFNRGSSTLLRNKTFTTSTSSINESGQ